MQENPVADRLSQGRWKRFLIPVLVILSASGIAFALIKTKAQHDPVEVREKAWLVGVQAVQPGTYAPSLTLYGRVESLWSSTLTAGVAADVREVNVIEGDNIAADTLLVQLDERDARLDILQREAELKEAEAKVASEHNLHQTNLEALPRERKLLSLARKEVERLQDLVERKVGSQSQLDTARQSLERQAIALRARERAVLEHDARLAEVEARRARAAALLEQARLELERCRVRAPFRGVVSKVVIAPGKRVRVGDALLEMYDTDNLVLRAQIPTRYLPAVHAAMQDGKMLKVEGVIDDIPVTAALRSLAGEAVAATGGVEGLFEIGGSPRLLQQGRFTRLDLKLPAQEGLIALPHEAIYGTDRVYVMDAQNRMRPVRVRRVGELRVDRSTTRVLLRSANLQAGDRVITTQLPNAIDGLLVRVAGRD